MGRANRKPPFGVPTTCIKPPIGTPSILFRQICGNSCSHNVCGKSAVPQTCRNSILFKIFPPAATSWKSESSKISLVVLDKLLAIWIPPTVQSWRSESSNISLVKKSCYFTLKTSLFEHLENLQNKKRAIQATLQSIRVY